MVGTNKSKIRGCSSFIQVLNYTLVCTSQQSMNHIIYCELERFNFCTSLSRYGTRMKSTNPCIDSRFDQWLFVMVKWKPSFKPIQVPWVLGKTLLVIPWKMSWNGSNAPSANEETHVVMDFLSSPASTPTTFDPLFSQVLFLTIGTKCIPLWSMLTTRLGGKL